jgi:hypothetical protein
MSNAEKNPSEISLEKHTIERLQPLTGTNKSVSFHQEDDIAPENVWFYCPDCDEEYHLPEDYVACPLCDCDQMVCL